MVVIIVAILAVLAIPSISARMRDRRTQQAAGEVMNLYRAARMRAMGRGSAVLVGYTKSGAPEGKLELREAIRGGSGNCAQMPVTGCQLTDWTATGTNKLIGEFNPGIRSEYSGVEVELAVGGVAATQMDVCFTPMGRAFARADGGVFAPLTQVPVATVQRKDGGSTVGLIREILILPNGHARIGTSRLP